MKSKGSIIKGIIYALLMLASTMISVHGQTITIPVDKNLAVSKPVMLTDIAEEISYIPLETNPNCLISNVFEIEFIDSLFFVTDYSDNLFIYSNSGKFISKIACKGKGPGEFISISDFAVNPDKDEVIILDGTSGKVLTYSYKGKFIKKFRIDFSASNIGCLKEWLVLYTPMNAQNEAPAAKSISMVFLDHRGKQISVNYSNMKNSLDKSSSFMLNSSFHRFNDHLLFREPFSDTVLLISESMEVKPFIYLDLGNRKIPQELYLNPDNFRNSVPGYIELGDVWELFDKILVIFNFDSKLNAGIYNKSDKEFYTCENSKGIQGIENDIVGNTFQPKWIGANNELITSHNAMGFMEKFESLKSIAPQKCKISIASPQIQVESNPIIEMVRLRRN